MNDYRFNEKWFDIAIPVWEQIFKHVPCPKDILEVGCYEGRATTWLCDNVIKGDSVNYDVVDSFGGSLSEYGMKNTKELLEQGNFIEDNFRHNISFHSNVNFTIHKGYSQTILPALKNKQFDFIYIDASHRADDTFVDAYYAMKMLRKGGLIIFDDYGWKDPSDNHPSISPQLGVDMFNEIYNRELQLVFQGYQVGFLKK